VYWEFRAMRKALRGRPHFFGVKEIKSEVARSPSQTRGRSVLNHVHPLLEHQRANRVKTIPPKPVTRRLTLKVFEFVYHLIQNFL